MSKTVRSPLTLAQYQALLEGLPKFCPNAVFTIAGQSYTTPQAVTLITSILSVYNAAAPAKAAAKAASQAVETTEAEDGQIAKGIREIVALMFNNAPTTLASLGIVPRKSPRPLTTQERAAATAKFRATRLARGTTSKKPKAKVTGNVTGVEITPVLAPTTAAPATPPAVPAVPAAPATGSSTPHA
jgi:hypothetical protein